MCEINGELFICDGHLRKDLIYELINDGHQVPDEFSYYLIDVNNDRKKAIDILFSFNTKTNPIDIVVLTEWVNIEQVEVEVTSLNVVDINEEIDYSDKNKEIDTDFLDQKYNFKLEYTEDEYNFLKDKIKQLGQSPEKIFYDALISL